jgi:hypothetical protein
MKKKLLLETVLKLKSDIERSIASTFDDIIKYNTTEKKIDTLWERLEKMEVQLIHFKEIIQEANKSKFEGKTNNFNIYFLSNLVAKSRFYENLEKALNRAPAKAKNAQIKKEEVVSKRKQIDGEITKFQNKLSAFNSKKKVTVYLDESLNLL